MAVNAMTFEQSAALLAELHLQATGQRAPANINSGNFTSVANVTLSAGYDKVLNAIGVVLSRTIFGVRSYRRKFGGIQVDNAKYGAIVRKINFVDKDPRDSVVYDLVDGASIDPWIVCKPDVLQLNFYGSNIHQRCVTIMQVQLDQAFRSSEELGSFWTSLMTHVYNMIEQDREEAARTAVANFITGKIAANNGVIHLLTEYNNATGLSLTATTVYQPANFEAFVRWLFARVNTLSKQLEERSSLFHINVTGKEIQRHTPQENQRIFILDPFKDQMEAEVLATTYHDNYLTRAYSETVTYWQGIQNPGQVIATPTYLATDGTLTTANAPVSQSNVLGLIVDEEALGLTVIDETVASSPLNPRGLYYTQWFSYNMRYWNDFSENGIVLLLD